VRTDELIKTERSVGAIRHLLNKKNEEIEKVSARN